jgi:hypothetical protein
MEGHGQFGAAHSYFRRAAALQARASGPESESIAELLTRLGTVAIRRNNIAAARSYLEHALAIYKRMSGVKDPTVAGLLEESGPLIWDRYRTAIHCRYLSGVLPAHPDHSRDEDSRVAETIADFATSWNRRLVADPQHTVNLHRDQIGPDAPAISLVLSHVGAQVRRRHQLDLARQYLLEAISIQERVFSPDHQLLANTLIELGMLSWEQADLVGARSYLERTTDMHRKALGRGDPAVRTLGLLLALVDKESKEDS